MRTKTSRLICLTAALAAALMVQRDGAWASPTATKDAALQKLLVDYQRPTSVPDSATNPMTPARIELGKALFFDPRLSGSGVISCATCHNPGLAWGDGLARGQGHMGKQLDRHTPTILNVAFGEPYFWDGRAATLEDQAKGPLASEAEMNMPHANVVSRVSASPGYVKLFATAYPDKPISIETVAAAIAAFERTVVSGTAPFDRWVRGDSAAVDDAAKRGFVLFNGKARCANCHAGWRFSDDGFHDIGVAGNDPGRARVVPGIAQLQHAFKTPTLRNINERSPYMHDGSIATLEAVVDHYNDGFVRRDSLDAEMVPLNLTAREKNDLVEFMQTLTSNDEPVIYPVLPR